VITPKQQKLKKINECQSPTNQILVEKVKENNFKKGHKKTKVNPVYSSKLVIQIMRGYTIKGKLENITISNSQPTKIIRDEIKKKYKRKKKWKEWRTNLSQKENEIKLCM